MNVLFLGVSRRHGKGKNTGNPYDICELHYAAEIKPKRTENYQFTGVGHSERTVPCNPDCLDDFEGVALGEEISVLMEPQPENPRLSWVTGLAE